MRRARSANTTAVRLSIETSSRARDAERRASRPAGRRAGCAPCGPGSTPGASRPRSETRRPHPCSRSSASTSPLTSKKSTLGDRHRPNAPAAREPSARPGHDRRLRDALLRRPRTADRARTACSALPLMASRLCRAALMRPGHSDCAHHRHVARDRIRERAPVGVRVRPARRRPASTKLYVIASAIAARREQIRDARSESTRAARSRRRAARATVARRRRNRVVADHPADFLDQVFLDRDVEAKRGRRHAPAVGVALDLHLEPLEQSRSITASRHRRRRARARSALAPQRHGWALRQAGAVLGRRHGARPRPPQIASSNSVARSIARACRVGSTPRSKRSDASVCSP